MRSKSRSAKSPIKSPKEAKLSRTHAPAELAPIDWQRALRRQFVRVLSLRKYNSENGGR